MISVIVLCLFGFSLGAPHLQKSLIIQTENKTVEELTGIVIKIIGPEEAHKNEFLLERMVEALSAIQDGRALVQEDVEIISEHLIRLSVEIGLGIIMDASPEVDIEILREKGLDLKTLYKAVFKLAVTQLGVENLLKRAHAGEDVGTLLSETLSTKEIKMIGCKAVKRADVKSIRELYGQDFISDSLCDEGVRVLQKVVSPVIGPSFSYSFALDNGIAERRVGMEGPNGTSIMQGLFTIPLDGGDVATFNWVADENGYRVESPHLPTPPPTPQHVAQLLRIAEEQRAAGVTFD